MMYKIVGEEFISYYGGYAYIVSNGECKFHVWERKEDVERICEKLNIVHEENQSLKEHLKYQKGLAENFRELLGESNIEVIDLKEENQQLRKALKKEYMSIGFQSFIALPFFL